MNLIIFIYLIVCVVLLIFDISFLVAKNMRNQRYYPKMDRFRKRVEEEMKRNKKGEGFSDSFLEVLSKRLNQTKYLIALQSVLEQYPEEKDLFKPYIFSCLKDYRKKSSYEQAYYAFVISWLGYDDAPVPVDFASEFIAFLDSKSLYTFSNAMNAIYEFRDTNLMLIAVQKIDDRAGFYHQKLFVDGLLQAKVDKNAFCKKLFDHYEKYSGFTKVCILNYFRYANVEVSGFCLNIMRETAKDREEKYAAMRYFMKHPCQESKEFFIDILEKETTDWVEEMLAIQALFTCKEEKVRDLIKKKIYSPNWNVRFNATDFLRKYGLDKKEIEEIVAFDDKFANDLLLYQYRDDKEMFDFISGLIQKEGAA